MGSTTTFINANGTYFQSFQLGNGATIRQGHGVPSNSIGVSGDIFMSTSTALLYIYINGAWVPIAENSNITLYAIQLLTGTYGSTLTGTIGQGTTYSKYLCTYVLAPWCSSNLTLPANPSAGLYVVIKDSSGTTSFEYPITVIDSGASKNYIIDIPYGTIQFLYTGTKWVIVSSLTSYPVNEMRI